MGQFKIVYMNTKRKQVKEAKARSKSPRSTLQLRSKKKIRK
jgi:hypothetical protein